MREDLEWRAAPAGLADIGAASELTKGDLMPEAYESIVIRDRFEE